jgi:hypothetical protein
LFKRDVAVRECAVSVGHAVSLQKTFGGGLRCELQ